MAFPRSKIAWSNLLLRHSKQVVTVDHGQLRILHGAFYVGTLKSTLKSKLVFLSCYMRN